MGSPPNVRNRWPMQWREMWEVVEGAAADAADAPRAAARCRGGQPFSAEPGGGAEQSSAMRSWEEGQSRGGREAGA